MTTGVKDHTQEINPIKLYLFWYHLLENLDPDW